MPTDPILVTRAAGYIGRHVVTALLDRGAEVVALVRPGSRSDVDPRATVLAIDVLAADLDVTTLLPRPPAAVVHLAWQDGFAHNAPSHVLGLSGHFRLLLALAEWGVPRVAVLGTMHEVGYWEGPITADTPTDPLSLYGIAKDALRRSCLTALAARVELQWLRCYYIVGDDRRNQSIFTRLLETADRGETQFPFTSGANRYDFVDVGELGAQIAVLATTPGVTGVINCGTGEPTALKDRVERFIRDEGLDITLQYGAFPDRPYDSPGVWGDASTIRQVMATASSPAPPTSGASPSR